MNNFFNAAGATGLTGLGGAPLVQTPAPTSTTTTQTPPKTTATTIAAPTTTATAPTKETIPTNNLGTTTAPTFNTAVVNAYRFITQRALRYKDSKGVEYITTFKVGDVILAIKDPKSTNTSVVFTTMDGKIPDFLNTTQVKLDIPISFLTPIDPTTLTAPITPSVISTIPILPLNNIYYKFVTARSLRYNNPQGLSTVKTFNVGDVIEAASDPKITSTTVLFTTPEGKIPDFANPAAIKLDIPIQFLVLASKPAVTTTTVTPTTNNVVVNPNPTTTNQVVVPPSPTPTTITVNPTNKFYKLTKVFTTTYLNTTNGQTSTVTFPAGNVIIATKNPNDSRTDVLYTTVAGGEPNYGLVGQNIVAVPTEFLMNTEEPKVTSPVTPSPTPTPTPTPTPEPPTPTPTPMPPTSGVLDFPKSPINMNLVYGVGAIVGIIVVYRLLKN
jgi:hypothetical protein